MGVIDNSIIHVNDVSQKLSSLIPQDSNTSNVEHYWKQEFLASRSAFSSSPSCSDHIVSSMQVGKRCIVRTSVQKPRFAKIAYIGPTHFDAKQEAIRPNNWVGVIYENPEGKNDGSLDGKRYFTCRPNYGGFVLPTSIEVLEEDGHFVNDQSDNDQIEEI
uniref:CAP-Gly domain-containing protein n=2 Tax=Meloidogyne incognita group TaxID=654580 RepID=A0A915MD04_MELJA